MQIVSMKAQFFIPAVCAALAVSFSSCTHQNPGVGSEDAEIADQVANGTIPPWIAENADSYETGAYNSTQSTQSSSQYAYNPPAKPKVSGTSSSSKTSRKSSAKPRSKSVAKSSKSSPKRSSSKSYTVKKNDTLGAIAKRNGTTVSAIKRANGLKSDLIQIDQKLSIPRK